MTRQREFTSVRLQHRSKAGPVTLALTPAERADLDVAWITAKASSLGEWVRDRAEAAAEGYDGLQDAADQAGMPLAAWVRVVCLTAAGRSDLLSQLQRVASEEQR